MSGIQLANLFTCLLLVIFNGLATKTNAVDGKNIVCYYSSWSAHRPDLGSYAIDDIPINMCTHLVYSFIGLNNRTWELLVLDPANDISKGGYRRFTSLKKRNPNLKTLISVGGWVEGGHKYSEMASKPERRKIFVNSVVDFIKWFNFDGLDLDWEFPGSADREGRAEDKDNFLQLVTELREAFDKEGWGWSLTAVVPIMPFRIDTGYHVEKLASMLDHMHLLTYDLRGNWTGFADIHTPLNQRHFDAGDYKTVNMNDGAALWERLGAPKEKLLIGLALYGRSYTLADVNNKGLHAPLQIGKTAGDAGPYTKANGTLAYYEICQLQREGGWEQTYDEISESTYMVKGDQWIGFDDRENLVKKVKHFQDKGYGGVSVWAADLDDFRGLCGEPLILLSAIYKQITGRSALSAQPFPSTPTFALSTFPPLPSIVTTQRPLVTHQSPPVVTTTTPIQSERRDETVGDFDLQTPSTLSLFEDSQRLQPNIDHFRTTVSPFDAISSPPLTPSVNFELPRPLTQRPPLRRRPTTLRVTTTTTTPANLPREETIVDVSIPEIQPTEPAIPTVAETSITTTAAPVTRRPFGGRPLRTRGRRPVAATETNSHATSVAPRNRTRPVTRQPGRRIARPTTTTVNSVTINAEPETTTTLPTTTTLAAATTTSTAAIPTTVSSAATTAQPIVHEQPTTEGTEQTTVSTKRPFQRRLRRPLNRTSGAISGRVRRPPLPSPVNQNDTELTAEESVQSLIAVRFPLPRVPKIWKPEVFSNSASQIPECNVDGPKYYPHQLCDQYWECLSPNVHATLRTCTNGSIWNPQKSICDWLNQNTRTDCE
ncbi:Chitinase 5 [Chamberlinius hualienensis]